MSDHVSKHDQVLMALSLNLQSIAMVQLGKVTSPATGELERDLAAARATIDILEMLKVKCRTDTAAPVLRLLDQAVMDLQMNYLDELKQERRAAAQKEPAADAGAADGGAGTAGDAGAGEAGDGGAGTAGDEPTAPGTGPA
jgi:hypothetical protein